MNRFSNMSKRNKFSNILKCINELNRIEKAKSSSERKKLLKLAENCVIDGISELALNCLKGNLPIKSCDFKTLKKYKTVLRQISKSSPVNKRRKIIVQKGGFLPILIKSALGLLGSYAFNYMKEKLSR